MTSIDLSIEIVSSNRKAWSSMSDESRQAIRATLSKYYRQVRITLIDSLTDLEALAARRPDLVFLGMTSLPLQPSHGSMQPSRIWLTDFLDEHGIPYTGSSSVAHRLETNKPLAKQQVLKARLQTSRFFLAKQGQPLYQDDISLRFPVFIKPSNRGGGAGIDSDSVAYSFAALKTKVQAISTKLHADALIEEYLPGREFSVAILKNEHDGAFSVMPIELVAQPDHHGARFLGKAVKSANGEQVLPVSDPNERAQVGTLALEVFHALKARDYGRIDIRLNAAGVPHFLEANLLPSLISGYGSFPKACELNCELDYASMLLRIVRLALKRQLVPAPQLIPAVRF